MLGAKHFIEKNINHTIYPFNLPSKNTTISSLKRPSKPPKADTPKQAKLDDFSPAKPTSGKLPTESASTSINPAPMLGNMEEMQGDEPAGSNSGSGGSSGAHGQTANIFSGNVLTYKKTYRLRAKASLPRYQKTDKIINFYPSWLLFCNTNRNFLVVFITRRIHTFATI